MSACDSAVKEVTFIDRAAEGLKRHIPVIPALPRDKKTVVGAKAATTDASVVEKWNAQNPEANSALVAQARIGGVWILDCDDPEVLKEIEKETNQPFPKTFRVRSSKAGHCYFKHNEESLNRLKNFSLSRDGKERFSVRWDNQYCIGPLSVHPSGAVYTTVSDVEPVEAPTFLIDWLLEQSQKYNLPASATNTIDESSPIPEGQRNKTITSRLGKINHAAGGASYETLLSAAKDINEYCVPPLPDSELETIAHSVSKYPVKVDEFKERMELKAQDVREQQAQAEGVLDVSKWRQQFRSVGELEKGNVRMLINGLLPEGTTFIGGLPGEGKTLLALSIAKALTTGKNFLGCEEFGVSQTVPVLYLIPEVSARAFRQRCEKFHIPDDPNLFLCRTISEGSTLLLDNPIVLEAVKRMRPVVFLDTVLRFNEAEDENAASQNKALVDQLLALRNAGASIVGLHHSTKAMRKEGMSLEAVLRGTGDLAAMCDAVYGLLRDEALYDHNRGPNEIEVACVKPRDFEPPAPFRIAASRRADKPSVIGTALGIVSNIDDFGDFLPVSLQESQKALGEMLGKLVTDDPAITLPELAKATKISIWVARQTLKREGWTKPRGGAKGGSQWTRGSSVAPKVATTKAEGSRANVVSFDAA